MTIRLACAAILVAFPGLPAQIQPSLTEGITCNARHVYVLRGNEVIQLDAETLKVERRTTLPGVTVPAVAAEPPVEVEEIVEVEESSGGKAMARAIELGLEWLKAHQDKDGHWDADDFMKRDVSGTPSTGPGDPTNDVGVTGLAILAFLGDGNTLNGGPYAEQLESAIRWLRDQQDANTGLIGTNASHTFIYDHAIATYAVVEAYGLSHAQILKPLAQNAINYLERHRNPYSVWRYQPRDNDNDTSVTSWCVMAYAAGRDFGLDVNENSLQLAASWFDQMTDPETGRTGYTSCGGRSSRPVGMAARFPPESGEAMTAATLFCRYLLGQRPSEQPVMVKQAQLLGAKPPRWDAEGSTVDPYYWHFGALAAYQTGGAIWQTWHQALSGDVAAKQRSDGNFRGSWDPIGPWGEAGGRVYSTALLTMALQSSYRYARLAR